jgi:hypothetical protein
VAAHFKDLQDNYKDAVLGDGILSIIQNGYRACKKYIAINFDYY